MSIKKQGESVDIDDDRLWFEPDVATAPAMIVGTVDEKAATAVELAYVPTESQLSHGDESVMVKLIATGEGEVLALAYSSVEELVRCCGFEQPWVAFEVDKIDALPGVTGADALVWNEELPPDLRQDSADGRTGPEGGAA